MAKGQGNFNAGDIENVDIQLDVSLIVQAIANNPTALNALAKVVRDQLLKDARQKGTLFRQWGGTK
jgi:hypothetical protein